MRTTLTLDDDVSIQLKRLQQEQQRSFKDLVNQALRTGLMALEANKQQTQSYQTQAVSVGRCLIGSLDDIAEVLSAAENEAFR